MEEKKLNILAIQMNSIIGDKIANFKKVEELIESNIINRQVDIIILPEVWTVGWKCSEFKDSAEDLNNSETIDFLAKIAKKHNVNIIGGSFITRKETGNGKQGAEGFLTSFFNTCPVINRKGELVATYDKMHLFSYYGCLEGNYVENGEHPVIVDFDSESCNLVLREQETENRGIEEQMDGRMDFGQPSIPQDIQPSASLLNSSTIKIGLSICYDIRFPELYRAYRKAGADLLINMAAWPRSRAGHWEALSKARAIENQCFMVALTQSGLIENDEWNLGHSRVIDFNGEVVSEIDNGEGAMYAKIDFENMYEFRNKCTVLNDIHNNYNVIGMDK